LLRLKSQLLLWCIRGPLHSVPTPLRCVLACSPLSRGRSSTTPAEVLWVSGTVKVLNSAAALSHVEMLNQPPNYDVRHCLTLLLHTLRARGFGRLGYWSTHWHELKFPPFASQLTLGYVSHKPWYGPLSSFAYALARLLGKRLALTTRLLLMSPRTSLWVHPGHVIPPSKCSVALDSRIVMAPVPALRILYHYVRGTV
jgi:hypothetical protein